MRQKTESSQRILKAALKEFSTYGFAGARMERIAKSAKINKAMIFYYFSSKKNLYQRVVKEVFDQISPLLFRLVSSNPSAEEFLEQIAEIYIDFVSRNTEFVKMVMLELIQNPKNIASIITGFFKEKMGHQQMGPPQLIGLIKNWREENVISEDDPFQFMLNVVSLSLLSFLGKPFLEAVFRLSPTDSPPHADFYQKRIKSVVNVLKRGMLT
ncbi:MAG: TetR/AcrR family transcriptional regulator [Candidatus Aminicenantes bacterium]|jgi:AcrR family transcriptional regulator